MEKIQGYEIQETLLETKRTVVYRALKSAENKTVTIKILKNTYFSHSELARFKQKYDMIKAVNPAGIVKILDVFNLYDGIALVSEYFDGVSFKRFMQQGRRNIKSFLDVAIKLSETLGYLHEKDIVHKNLNPGNILINRKTDEVKITGFGISSALIHEKEGVYHPDFVNDTLPYISPEQTGRMNRIVDFRTDFYSLGVIFYKWLTGVLPFQSKDPMEIFHCHLAKKPASPVSVSPESNIPDVISDIIMKLLSKEPEERYQSAFGLMADLQMCLKQYSDKKRINPFLLAQNDISNKFIMSQKLFGRDKEMQTLLTIFERVYRGKNEITFVKGPPGIGKSALVSEIHRPIVTRRGYYITGKYEQLGGDVPYNGIVQAFSMLVRQILSQSESNIRYWKDNLLSVLGANAKAITDMIPDVELIIGEQPELEVLGPEESRNRFNYMFEQFVSAFTRDGYPVALFLDNLQWADEASFQLIESLITSPNISFFLVVGLYRDNEISELHPLREMQRKIQTTDIRISEISPEPLSEDDVFHLVSDLLRRSDERGGAFAELVYKKTNGNPFFIKAFLKRLYDEKRIQPDSTEGWQWDMDEIRKMQVTDNVVDLLIENMLKLPEQTLGILKASACIGNQFKLETLSKILDTSIDSVLSHVTKAIDQGFVNFVDEIYVFSHNRIHETAYSLNTEEEKGERHYRIGCLTLDESSEADLRNNLFYLVDQLNLGVKCIQDAGEQQMFVQLNLEAGKRAKASAAHAPAFNYLKTGINLLEKDHWYSQYDLALELHTEAVETAFLNGNFDQMSHLSDTVLAKSRSLVDKTKVYNTLIKSGHVRQDFVKAVRIGLDALELFGFRFRDKPYQEAVIEEMGLAMTALADKSDEDILSQPDMKDPEMFAAVQILINLAHVTFQSDPDLYPLLILKTLNTVIRHGSHPLIAYIYVCYGIILVSGLDDINNAYRYGKLAYKLIDKYQARELRPTIDVIMNILIRHWVEPFDKSIVSAYEGYRVGVETGNLEFAAWNLALSDIYRCNIIDDNSLPELAKDMAKHHAILRKFNSKPAILMHSIYRQLILNFMGQSQDPTILTGDALDEQKTEAELLQAKNYTGLATLYNAKLFLLMVFRKYDLAFEYFKTLETYKESTRGSIVTIFLNFMGSLIRIILYPSVSGSQQKEFLDIVEQNQLILKKWTELTPVNFQHRYYIIEAERAGLLGNVAYAMACYDKAISHARKYHYPDEGYYSRLAADFYLSLGQKKIAGMYITDAYQCLQRWGAVSVVDSVKKEYGDILQIAEHQSANIPGSTISGALDISSVMKASQALSGEMVLNRLLVKMMKITLENAGAERGFLIFEKQGELFVEAQAEINRTEIPVLESIPIHAHSGLSTAIVNFTARKKDTLILNNATKQGEFINDPYVIKNKPKSILCTPLVNKGNLIALLYLENNLSVGAFTPMRIEVIQLLASQAAISFENAILFEKVLQSESALKISEQKFRSLYENAVEGIFQISPNGRFISVNPSMAYILGYHSPEDILSRDMYIGKEVFLSHKDFLKYRRELRTRGRITDFETQVRRKNGDIVWVSVTARVVRDADGKIILYEGSLLDISERKEKEIAEEERRAAQAAMEAKSEFLANMSHEIRTPMNAILGFSNLAIESRVLDKQNDYLKKIRSAADSLLGIINDILDFSKIEAGKLTMEQTEFQLYTVLEDLSDMFSAGIAEKELELMISVESDVPSALIGDPLRLKQILINLVGNALKFTEKGEIVVNVAQQRTTDDGIKLKFSVQDTGIGITPEQKKKLFSSFTQADSSTTRHYGGTGLGLAICKRLVEMMSGHIDVTSIFGQGTTFSFTACFGRQADIFEPDLTFPDEIKALRMLVVDDNDVSRAYIVNMLGDLGGNVVGTSTIEDAMKKIRYGYAQNDPFGLVVTDWRKPPFLDGIGMCKKLKTDFQCTEIPVVVMTFLNRKDDMVKAGAAGADLLLNKPVTKSMLFEKLMRLFNRNASGQLEKLNAGRKKVATIPLFSGKKILIVEDNSMNQEVVSEILSPSGISIDMANNGKEAVDCVSRSEYHAVLMDVQMPVMDGYQATTLIRKDARHKNLPIIAMTAHTMKEEQEKCTQSGMDDFITKPINPDQLFAALVRWIKPDKDAIQTAPLSDIEVSTEPLLHLPGIDMVSGVKRVRGNKELFLKLIIEFSEQCANVVREIKDARKKEDETLCHRLVHTVKGVAGNISANELYTAACELENVVRIGSENDIEKSIENFEIKLNQILKAAEIVQQHMTDKHVDNIDDCNEKEFTQLITLFSQLNKSLEENSIEAKEFAKSLRIYLNDVEIEIQLDELDSQIDGFNFKGARMTLIKIASILNISFIDTGDRHNAE